MKWVAAVMASVVVGCASAQVPPVAPTQPVAVSADAPRPFDTSDQLLDALQRATDGLHDFRANVIYDRLDAITEDRERRIGRIVLQQDDKGARRFAITFGRAKDRR